MANKRIKDLSTTASTTASDDFFGVDGATNGTRKLNAYSPTFGGNLTVSGTGTHSFNGPVSITSTTASNILRLTKSGAGSKTFGIDNALDFRIYADNGSTQLFKLTDSGDTTLTGNLTVSGGTITSGSGTLTLNSSANTVVLQSAGTTALTLDSSQNATFAGKITANGAGSTFKGTATNDSAAAGYVGELISGNDGGGVALTTGTRTNIASISLTAGDWDVTGYVGYLPSGGASSTYQEGSISATSATIGAAGARTLFYTTTTAQTEIPLPTVRVSLASTTTYYLVSLNTFIGGTMSGTGIIRARRVR